MRILVVVALGIFIPSANTINWLRTKVGGALHIAVSVWAGITVMGRGPLHFVSAALLVLVGTLIVLACSISTPSSQAIHRLGTALSGALFKSVRIRASITIVGSISANCVSSAPSVLVVDFIMLTGTIRAPVSNTVNRLRAAVGGASNFIVSKWTRLASQIRLGGDLVGSATLVLVAHSKMIAGTK